MVTSTLLRRHAHRGFTLVELLVVIGIIALLISILLPTFGAARQQANMVKCLAQLRQLGNATVIYSLDNRGWLPSCDTCGPLFPATFYDAQENLVLNNPTGTHTWVGWVDGGPTLAALQNGTLWKYLRSAGVYKCPSDLNEFRNRTYSVNNLICTGSIAQRISNLFKIFRINQATSPAITILFAEEADPRSTGATASQAGMASQWNVNGWVQNPLATDSMSGMGNTANTWCDTITSWHRGGANFAFLDGHAENWRFSDMRTIRFLKNDPNWPSTAYVTPNNPDLIRIRSDICTWPQLRAQ